MKKNKIQNSFMISGNGSKQQLSILSYDNQTDLNENDFVRWEVMNADMTKRLINNTSVALRNGNLKPTPQDGLLEYDGTHLYFTICTTRKTVTLV